MHSTPVWELVEPRRLKLMCFWSLSSPVVTITRLVRPLLHMLPSRTPVCLWAWKKMWQWTSMCWRYEAWETSVVARGRCSQFSLELQIRKQSASRLSFGHSRHRKRKLSTGKYAKFDQFNFGLVVFYIMQRDMSEEVGRMISHMTVQSLHTKWSQ